MQSEHIVIDGKELANRLQDELKSKISKSGIAPVLAVVMVGNNEASSIYVRNKEKAAQKVGIDCKILHFSENISQEELCLHVAKLNNDESINGIIIQQPLPAHLNIFELLCLISPQKDVDGFSPINLGLLTVNSPSAMLSATPRGVMALLKETRVDLEGKNALVIGRSNIVGKPMAQMLLNANCTVTIAHSKTKNLSELVSRADIVVVACGVPKMLKAEWVKEGAIIIDVGINRVDGKLCGDVDFEKVKMKASFITPVPGGVGPLTVTMLLQNTYEAWCNQYNS